jgi:Protein of unknown function (DUF2958)
MRAILIDPEKKTLTEIEVKGDGDIDEIYKLLHCNRFASGAKLSGSIEEGFDSIWVSDDYLEDRDDPRFWFQVDADHNPPTSFPLAGLGLAHGTDDEGRMCDVKISVADLASRITFTRRKFRGFEVRKGRGKLGGLPVHELVSVTVNAPIIDGAEEDLAKTKRPESWNAKMLISGAPLITDEQFEKLLANAPPSFAEMETHDPIPVVKIFLPHIRWLLVWIYPDDHDRTFAIARLGNHPPKAGDVLLSEIVQTRLGTIMPATSISILISHGPTTCCATSSVGDTTHRERTRQNTAATQSSEACQ